MVFFNVSKRELVSGEGVPKRVLGGKGRIKMVLREQRTKEDGGAQFSNKGGQEVVRICPSLFAAEILTRSSRGNIGILSLKFIFWVFTN